MSGKKLANQVKNERQAKKKTIKSGRAPLPSKELTKERRKTSINGTRVNTVCNMYNKCLILRSQLSLKT